MNPLCWPKKIALGLITVYSYVLSPLLPPSCRFTPTCSRYAFEAIERYGFAKGLFYALRRIAKCHPLGGSGYDPLP